MAIKTGNAQAVRGPIFHVHGSGVRKPAVPHVRKVLTASPVVFVPVNPAPMPFASAIIFAECCQAAILSPAVSRTVGAISRRLRQA